MIGYKLHIDTADGDIPVSCFLTSASVHESQVATSQIIVIKHVNSSGSHIFYVAHLFLHSGNEGGRYDVPCSRLKAAFIEQRADLSGKTKAVPHFPPQGHVGQFQAVNRIANVIIDPEVGVPQNLRPVGFLVIHWGAPTVDHLNIMCHE